MKKKPNRKMPRISAADHIPENRQRLEPLREELHEYLDEGPGMRFIRHPFCNEPISDLKRCAWIHEMIDERTARADACFEAHDYEGYINCVEIYSQAEWLAKDADLLPDDRYWSLLGRIYETQRCPWWKKQLYDRLFRADRPGRENLMTPEEQDVLARLPDELKVYRGYTDDDQEGYAEGIAWTLHRPTAVWFANRHYESDYPRLITGKVRKRDVWAYHEGGDLLLPPEAVYDRRDRYVRNEKARSAWDEFIRKPFDVTPLLKGD